MPKGVYRSDYSIILGRGAQHGGVVEAFNMICLIIGVFFIIF